MGQYTLKALFRIMPKEYVESFITEGEIYLNTIKFHRQKDIYEGVESLMMPSDVVLGCERLNIIEQTLVRFYPDRYDSNIYCMYGIFENSVLQNSEHIINVNILLEQQPQNAIVIIYNILEFIQRVENECKAKNYTYQFSPVKYYDVREPQQGLTPFCKSDEYIAENEYRILIKGNGQEPIQLFLGDLRDIASVANGLKLND